MSVFNVFYNLFKSVSEIKIWFPLSDYEKRQMIFGDLYSFLVSIASVSAKNSDILIYSKDVKTFYLGIYYLYPRKITIVDNKSDFDIYLNTKKFKYIAVYKSALKPISYLGVVVIPKIGEIYNR
jgi:hypothetical protein